MCRRNIRDGRWHEGESVFSSRGAYIETFSRGTRERYSGEDNNVYKIEHKELFGSIRRDDLINNRRECMWQSTLLAILGRMATYTGQKVTWDQAMNSAENLSPSGYSWDAKPPESEIAIRVFPKVV